MSLANTGAAPNTKQRLDDLKADAIVDALVNTEEEKRAETLNERLVKEKTEALVDTLVFVRK